MPPTQHSNSTAHKESDGLQPNGLYKLGEYNFRLERSSVPGSSNDQITAVCMQGGKNARKSIQVQSSTKLESWYVEANETEATVYAVLRVPEGGQEYESDLDTGDWVPVLSGLSISTKNKQMDFLASTSVLQTIGSSALYKHNNMQQAFLVAASETYDSPGIITTHYNPDGSEQSQTMDTTTSVYTHNGKTVYYCSVGSMGGTSNWIIEANQIISGNNIDEGAVAWTLIYGSAVDPEYKQITIIVGRFAIDFEDAGGVGPGSDWDDPGDLNEDWEEGDPTQTLRLQVIGALSGRHNDPIEDPSYSYIPADKETMKDYGCGGDGGHGGGGGAGASTVVVHKFATNQADDKEIVALAKRHGYGSGGGKGGKGGDGCILVYY